MQLSYIYQIWKTLKCALQGNEILKSLGVQHCISQVGNGWKTKLTEKQVAQWATIAHLRASIMFGKTIIYDAQWQVTMDLKQWSGINSNTQDIMPVLVICKH